ncbi:MAG: 30S ribosomal protein S20 [Deltaproteobacteria bacterium]|nr:30S ribosomal protein S20 [Deltaproteobacteria bacterium]MBW2595350.1 30S ribosomal protein S20 [Deltaproteobacteria bacterium]
MATHKSAEKRARQSEKRRMRNTSERTRVKTSVKAALKSVEEKDVKKSRKVLLDTTKTIAKAAAKGIFRKNTAARKISRLTKKVNALG